jgi:hypothetical protein
MKCDARQLSDLVRLLKVILAWIMTPPRFSASGSILLFPCQLICERCLASGRFLNGGTIIYELNRDLTAA